MITAVQYRRLAALGLLVVVSLCALGFRLVNLQVVHHEKFRAEAKDNTERMYLREPRRGDIRDVRGNLLARSYFVKTVCANPKVVGEHYPLVARTLAPFLEMPEAELEGLLTRRSFVNAQGETVARQYQVLRTKVPVETWEQIEEAMRHLSFGMDESKLPRAERAELSAVRQIGIFADRTEQQLRIYPNDNLAAHVLGFVNLSERQTIRGKVFETAGKDGMELALNQALSGVQGWKSTEINRRRQEVVAFREQDVAARDGLNAVLTIDIGVQHIVESELAEVVKRYRPESASAIVVRPRTGEILAMGNWPTFDPANPGKSPVGHWRNRTITDIAEPGSTFKIVVVSAALNEGLIGLDDMFDCENGRWWYAGRSLRDTSRQGIISVERIIAKSSNIGAAKIGIQLGAPRMHRYMVDFGFGTPTGIPLLGEMRGTVHPVKNWNKLSITRVPMGHEIACTQLQMVMAMSAIANKGTLMRPLLVHRLEDNDGRVVFRSQPEMIRQVIGSRAAEMMVAALKTAVTADGTGHRAALEHYTVAGKSGTAQKAGRGTYLAGQYYSSFIGFFPADNPEVCISVVLDHPDPAEGYYGGAVAGPVFKNIAERTAQYLAIQPDLPFSSPPALTSNSTPNNPQPVSAGGRKR
jgi:cell division protein FtsI/penicillin-binding protein 2